MNKKVIIIGGGVSGLAAGIYAQKCGFDSTIIENHCLAGGNCTSWKRNDYLFEGGMHWLAGSKSGSPIYKLWAYVGALNDNVKTHYTEPFLEYDFKGTPIRLYRDVEKTEKEWLSLSPPDEKIIREFCRNIRLVKGLNMPITDIKNVKVTKKNKIPLRLFFGFIRVLLNLPKWISITPKDYAHRFKHDGIKQLFLSLPEENQGIIALFMTMGFLADGDGGFPEGGSLPFVERMVNTYKSLGGTLLLNTRAQKIIIENSAPSGVLIEPNSLWVAQNPSIKMLECDAVIITTDTMKAEQFFDIPLNAKWLKIMKEKTKPTSGTLISIGIDADLQNYPERPIFKLDTPICFADKKYHYLFLNNYANNRTYSPKGKTVITIQLPGDTYLFWKKEKENDNYREEKDRLASIIIRELTKLMPEIENKVEVVDIATPLTYERFCDNWKGSWMTEMSKKMITYPPDIKGLQGVYFAGHRMMPPGGLPPALLTARRAVQCLCRDTDSVFISEE